VPFAAALERPQMWAILNYKEQVPDSHGLQRESHRLLILFCVIRKIA